MSSNTSPYITACGFCEQGLLRFMHCPNCEAICAVCDECELVWQDIAAVRDQPQSKSSSTYPTCPACGSTSDRWRKLDAVEVRRAELDGYVAGESG